MPWSSSSEGCAEHQHSQPQTHPGPRCDRGPAQDTPFLLPSSTASTPPPNLGEPSQICWAAGDSDKFVSLMHRNLHSGKGRRADSSVITAQYTIEMCRIVENQSS